jgi:hypothetical protein
VTATAVTLLQGPPPADNKAVEAAEQAWRPIGEMLVETGLIGEEELEHALAVQKETGRLLGAILVERGYVSGPALALALARQHGVELTTERGFGTGLWAEIDRRHRAGRDRGGDENNVVQLEARPAALEAVPDPVPEPEPVLEDLRAENRRLQEEIERLRAELTKPRVVQAPEQPTSHVLFAPASKGYLLVERTGPPPEPGEELELAEAGGRLVVERLGRAPLPGERRPCAFLTRLV